ncbi:MAG: hypothetical protein E7539_03215 [Ruminococcaceae bacterium]|nr:hypothetical protein [Oscillospiraceae bacterium]
MFYQEYLKKYAGFSKAFNEFLYWCLSEDKEASFARARGDVSSKEILLNLDDKEKLLAQKLIRERLECTDDIFAVKLLSYCGETADIPLIEKKLSFYIEKDKNKDCNFEYCINTCREVIKTLKNKR